MSVRATIEERIASSTDDVFVTREFRDLGNASQVSRVLRALVADQKLVRMGQGVYARAFVSRLTGRVVLRAEGGFIAAARQALDKLGVQWQLTDAQLAYNEGHSTQVPVNPAVRVTGHCSRKLKVGNLELRIEQRGKHDRR